MDVLAVCLSQNSAFTGSLNKLILAKSTTGYIHTVAQLKSQSCSSMDWQVVSSNEQHEKTCSLEVKGISSQLPPAHRSYELPCAPPWFVDVGSQKLYHTLAQILRLVGLSLVAGHSRLRYHCVVSIAFLSLSHHLLLFVVY